MKLESSDEGTRCALRDGRSILLTEGWKRHVRIADRLYLASGTTTIDRTTPFYLERRQAPDLCQIAIVAARRPRRNPQGVPTVALDVAGQENGIARVFLTSAQIRDYFFAPDRTQSWQNQPSWYDLLGVTEASTPTTLRLSFQVTQLELRLAGAAVAPLARGIQILLDPELRDSYRSLQSDPGFPVPFPPYTVGSLFASGERLGESFFVSRVLRFVPVIEAQTVRVPLRKLHFDGPFAIYRNTRRKLLVRLDGALLPLSWTEDWNEWAHLTQGSMEVTADFWRQTRFRRREDVFEPVTWQMPALATITVKYPADVARKFEQAHAFWERFSPHADRIALLRSRIEREPVEEREAHAWCVEQGLSASIDVRLVSWHPDYHEVFYRELASRARQIYLFRNEYVFVLEGMVITEIPQFGHAAYFFRPPGTSSQFLRAYTQTTRHRIRCDPSGSRKTLGYQGRLPHLHDTAAWLEKLQHWVSGKAVRRAFI